MIPMICSKSLLYAGRRLNIGDAFGARSASDARLLAAIGKATLAPPDAPIPVAPPPPPPPVPKPAVASYRNPWRVSPDPVIEPPVKVEDPPSDPVVTDKQTVAQDKPKRQYHRRDLTAEK